MTVVPLVTPAPKPTHIFMPGTSSADSGPAPPAPTTAPDLQPPPSRSSGGEDKDESGGGEDFPRPKLLLEVRDISHPGARRFLGAVNATEVLETAVANVQRLLYHRPGDAATHMPPTRSVTIVLRDMGGVAFTTGSELDDDHKEVHFSLPYIAGIGGGLGSGGGSDRAGAAEITGVLTHELVHCYQWNARGTCPGGLIEGIADWVRLNCGLSPPHWRRETSGSWDGGYQHTAYFLEYLEGRFGSGTVRRLNEKLRTQRYSEKAFWTELVSRPVEQLWQDYVEQAKGEDGKGNKAR